MLNLMRLSMTQRYKKGDIWLANLNPTKGTESGKVRPVLIFQDQALLDIAHPSTLIIPLSTRLVDDAYPLRVRIEAREQIEHNSDLLIDQIRAIDNKRFIAGPLLSLDKKQLAIIHEAVCQVMGMI